LFASTVSLESKLESIEERLPTVKDMKNSPKIIHKIEIKSSNYVSGVISPYPTEERVVIDQ